MEFNSRCKRLEFHSEKNSSDYGGGVKNPKPKKPEPPIWSVAFRDRLAELNWSVPRLAKEMGHENDGAFIDRLYKVIQGRVEQPRGGLLLDIGEALKIEEFGHQYSYNRLGRVVRDRNKVSPYRQPQEPQELSSEDVAATLPEPDRPRTVKLKGYVGAGSEAHFYRIADEDFEEVPAPPNATDKTVAVEIRGKSWGPLMDTFRVYYDDIHSPIDPSMFGRPCIVGLADDRILLKVPFQQKNGLYRLVSNSDEPPIEDAIIEWAALVKSFMPKT